MAKVVAVVVVVVMVGTIIEAAASSFTGNIKRKISYLL